jgi:hypothetical protein
MARSTTLCIAACWLLAGSAARSASPAECLRCHEPARGVLAGPMATRSGERAFARRAFGAEGERFFAGACAGCHVTGCANCHGEDAHRAGRPKDEACLRCHKGYSAGWEYEGRAPREDHARYRRGATAQGEPLLKMLPDVHFERGMTCADCHTMTSLQEGKRAAAGCRDCHAPAASSSPEHAVAGHLEKMSCVACHASWAAQEYGTFLIRPATLEQEEAFSPFPAWGPWRKSAHLKRQDAPPLGLDEKGLVSPIRPRFLLFVTDLKNGAENRLVAAEWRAFSPHTVRRGTVACGGCHDNRRRFLLERDAERLYLLEKDGLPLRSYWNRDGQIVVNGAFFPPGRYERMNVRSPEYARQVVNRWQKLLAPAAPRSKR